MVSMGILGTKVFAQTKKIKIGVLGPSHCAMPVLWAYQSGLYKNVGISVEPIFARGMFELIKDLSKGKYDFIQLMTPMAFGIHVGSRALPKVPVALIQVLGSNGGALAVSTRYKITHLSDLKGKKIGVHSSWMVHSIILNMVLDQYGIDPKRDIEIIPLPFSRMASALKEGMIDAIIHPEPLPSILEKKKICRILLTTRIFWEGHPCCSLVCRKEYIKKEPRLVNDITLATMIAGLKLNHPAYRKDAIKKIHSAFDPYKSLPLAVLFRAFKPKRSDFYPFPFKSSGIILARQMKRLGFIPPEVPEEKLVDEVFHSQRALELLRIAAEEVPGVQLPQGVNRKEKIYKLKG